MSNVKQNAGAAVSAEAGFTLIEILLVVVIIGVLAAVVVPNLSGRVGQGNEAAAKADIKSLGSAIDLYELDNGRYPASLQNLVTKGGEKNWRGPYTKSGSIPKDPWGNDFQYTVQNNGYSLVCAGADGSFGTEDDIK